MGYLKPTDDPNISTMSYFEHFDPKGWFSSTAMNMALAGDTSNDLKTMV